jgi:predicted nucleic acid-binding protein
VTSPRTPRIYLDTSVWNFVLVEDVPERHERRELTRQLFDQIRDGDYEPYISVVVLDEMAAAPEPRRSELYDLVDELSPVVLELTPEVLALSKEYIQQGTIPAKYGNDALHIAVAVTNDLDLLLSWNFAHIVKLKTRRVVSATSRLLGYKEIEICSPEEVVDDAS